MHLVHTRTCNTCSHKTGTVTNDHRAQDVLEDDFLTVGYQHDVAAHDDADTDEVGEPTQSVGCDHLGSLL